jgi:hypothetical protein
MNYVTMHLFTDFLKQDPSIKPTSNSKFNTNSSQDDIEYIFEMVRRSSYVSQNPDYKNKATRTSIVLDKSDTVNAYAQTLSAESHRITILSGLINACALMAVGIAQFRIDKDLEQLIKICNWIGTNASSSGKFSRKLIWEGVERFNYDVNGIVGIEANSYLVGSILSVTGHELGHICLSHTIRGDWSNEVSRNDERQADLFAHSVVSTTPFASYTVLGTLFTEIIFAWMAKGHTGPATTHPHSTERVYNTINSHEEVLASLGITRDNIDEFLPSKNPGDYTDDDGDDENDEFDESDDDWSVVIETDEK